MTSYYELETIEAEGKESQKYAFQSDITIGRYGKPYFYLLSICFVKGNSHMDIIRGKDADVFIDLKSLSRKHARIEIDENRQVIYFILYIIIL